MPHARLRHYLQHANLPQFAVVARAFDEFTHREAEPRVPEHIRR